MTRPEHALEPSHDDNAASALELSLDYSGPPSGPVDDSACALIVEDAARCAVVAKSGDAHDDVHDAAAAPAAPAAPAAVGKEEEKTIDEDDKENSNASAMQDQQETKVALVLGAVDKVDDAPVQEEKDDMPSAKDTPNTDDTPSTDDTNTNATSNDVASQEPTATPSIDAPGKDATTSVTTAKDHVETAVFYAFCQTFRETLNLPEITVEELEAALDFYMPAPGDDDSDSSGSESDDDENGEKKNVDGSKTVDDGVPSATALAAVENAVVEDASSVPAVETTAKEPAPNVAETGTTHVTETGAQETTAALSSTPYNPAIVAYPPSLIPLDIIDVPPTIAPLSNILIRCMKLLNRRFPGNISWQKVLHQLIEYYARKNEFTLFTNPFMERPRFESMTLDVKIEILMNLIDWMLQDTVKLKGAIDARSHSRAKRIHPRKVTNELQACCVGEDSAKHVYWMFGGSPRLYSSLEREDGNPSWTVVSHTLDELKAYVVPWRRSRHRQEKALHKRITTEVIPAYEAEVAEKERLEREKRLLERRVNTELIVEGQRGRRSINYAEMSANGVDGDDDDEFVDAAAAAGKRQRPAGSRRSLRLNDEGDAADFDPTEDDEDEEDFADAAEIDDASSYNPGSDIDKEVDDDEDDGPELTDVSDDLSVDGRRKRIRSTKANARMSTTPPHQSKRARLDSSPMDAISHYMSHMNNMIQPGKHMPHSLHIMHHLQPPPPAPSQQPQTQAYIGPDGQLYVHDPRLAAMPPHLQQQFLQQQAMAFARMQAERQRMGLPPFGPGPVVISGAGSSQPVPPSGAPNPMVQQQQQLQTQSSLPVQQQHPVTGPGVPTMQHRLPPQMQQQQQVLQQVQPRPSMPAASPQPPQHASQPASQPSAQQPQQAEHDRYMQMMRQHQSMVAERNGNQISSRLLNPLMRPSVPPSFNMPGPRAPSPMEPSMAMQQSLGSTSLPSVMPAMPPRVQASPLQLQSQQCQVLPGIQTMSSVPSAPMTMSNAPMTMSNAPMTMPAMPTKQQQNMQPNQQHHPLPQHGSGALMPHDVEARLQMQQHVMTGLATADSSTATTPSPANSFSNLPSLSGGPIAGNVSLAPSLLNNVGPSTMQGGPLVQGTVTNALAMQYMQQQQALRQKLFAKQQETLAYQQQQLELRQQQQQQQQQHRPPQ